MSCRKLTFKKEADAKNMAKIQTERWGAYNRAYRCNICKLWHLTTEKLKDRRKRYEKKLF